MEVDVRGAEEQIFAGYEEIHTQLLKEVLQNAPEITPSLYHYTSLEGAQKIIESGQIRLTNIRYLNDPQELQSGLDILGEALEGVLQKIKNEPENLKIRRLLIYTVLGVIICLTEGDAKNGKIEKLKSIVGCTLEELSGFQEFNWSLYVASFSERKDALRQWMPYGQNAHGVTLGFDAQATENEHQLTLDNVELVHCSYASREKKFHFAEEALYAYYSWLKKHHFNDTLLTKITGYFTRLIVGDLAACKRHEYEDEEEWRIYSFQDIYSEDYILPEFYVSNGILRPYINRRYKREALMEVHLGPLCNPLNIESFRLLLQKHDMQSAITQSTLPYRG